MGSVEEMGSRLVKGGEMVNSMRGIQVEVKCWHSSGCLGNIHTCKDIYLYDLEHTGPTCSVFSNVLKLVVQMTAWTECCMGVYSGQSDQCKS